MFPHISLVKRSDVRDKVSARHPKTPEQWTGSFTRQLQFIVVFYCVHIVFMLFVSVQVNQ